MSSSSPSPEPSQYQSSIPELSLPIDGWKSNIPPHLLDGADPQLAWIMQEISKNTQATEFACRAVVAQNQHLKALNGKTFRNEKSATILSEKVEKLEDIAEKLSPFAKPMMQFAGLWEYRVFRWVFYAALFFFFTYILPYYITHPFDLSQFFKAVIPGS